MLLGESTCGDDAVRDLRSARPGSCELFFAEATGSRLALLADDVHDHPAWTFTPVVPLFSGGRGGAAAGDWLFRVGFWLPREHRAEFLDWYEHEHLPMLLACDAWDGCRFVEMRDPGGCRFAALHQLSDASALASPERARSRATPWFLRLKRFEWFDAPFTRTLYRRSTERTA